MFLVGEPLFLLGLFGFGLLAGFLFLGLGFLLGLFAELFEGLFAGFLDYF